MEARILNENLYSVARDTTALPWRAAARRALAKALATLRLWVRRSLQRSELRALIGNDDRFFRDIGLGRADVHYESHKWFWRA